MNRMDIIPVSIALAQAAKESGWGTSRFALRGKCNFWSMDMGWTRYRTIVKRDK